jgi:MFS family permease
MASAMRAESRTANTRRITFYVALAVFAQESTWNFYDNRVPELLRDHVASAAVIGLIMGMDNLLGIFIQPYMGNRSDNTRTAWGRRIPYLAVMMPVGAALFLLIPHMTSLGWLMLVIFLYALVMNSFKPISESLMPDFIEPAGRSRANAVVKIASALTTIVAALVSLLLVDDHPKLAFAVPSAIMLVAVAVLVWRVRDSRSQAYQAALVEDRASAATGSREVKVKVRTIIKDLLFDADRSRLLVIIAVFLFGGAWFASRSLVTPYGVQVLGLSDGEAGGLTLPSGIVFILAAFPAALLAERFGRLRIMAAGISVFALSLIIGTVFQTATMTVVALCLAAAGATGFMINALVVLWNLAPSSRVLGTYTGLYTVGWASGGFIGPALVGLAVDLTGWHLMLLHTAVLAVIAVALVIWIDRLRRASDARQSAE